MGSAEDAFQTALLEFKKRLTPKEEANFQFTTLSDVRNEIARIQKDQESLKQMMNMPRIQSFLEAMDQFGKVIEVFLNASEFVAFVWGPVKFVLQVASTWADSFDTLLNAYEQIGEHIPLLVQYSALFDNSSHMRDVLVLIYGDILDFHKGAIRFFSGRVWRQLFRSAWKDFGARFKYILDALSRHRGLIERQAAVLHYQQYQEDSQATLNHIQLYQHDRIQLIEKLDRMEDTQREKDYVSVVEWMSSAQTKREHDDFSNIRGEYPGTGCWILKHEKMQKWKEADTPVSSILWVNGIPGAGKTILASVIIEACLQDDSYRTAYFYCAENEQKDNCLSVLRGLLSQLLSQTRDLVPYCHEKRIASGEVMLNSEILARQLLGIFFQAIPKQFIIIDGLDECTLPERKSILSFFTTTVDRLDALEPGKLRVLFVSQDYPDIGKALPTAVVYSLRPEDNQRDIKLFVDEWGAKIKAKHDLEDDQIEFISRTTRARAGSMFLFAKLVVRNLYDQPTRQRLLEEIKASSFPQGLEDAYERIMKRIKRDTTPEEWNIAHQLLGWMVCAKRPLKWHEIQGAVSIDSTEQTIDFDDLKLRVHIRDLCGSLIQVSQGDRIELVHSTAKRFITKTGYVRELIVECNLTALCLQYLTFACFEKDVAQDELLSFTMKGYFAFQDYAVSKWFHHLNAMIKAEQDVSTNDFNFQSALDDVTEALDDFANYYEDEILHKPVVDESEEACKAFKSFGLYETLSLVWSHIYRNEQKGIEGRNAVSIRGLGEVLDRNRRLIEGLSSGNLDLNSKEQRVLNDVYGTKRFKCTKLTCFFFHEGFKDATTRDVHINRHDRPFNCTFPDCASADFGFTTNKVLEKHMKNYHPETNDEANSFPTLAAAPITTPHVCNICDKKFTRGFILRNHIRSHNEERPFACSECGKAFTRANDCRRHEKIHARK